MIKNSTLFFKVAILSLFVSTVQYAAAQCTVNAVATDGVFLDGITIANSGISVAYNPDSDIYYTAEGGSSAMSLVTFDAAGTEIATSGSCGYDFRGIWWNPNLDQLECNAYSTTGVRLNDLDGSDYALNTGSIILPSGQPDNQSMGKYDYDDDEIIYHFSGTIYRYDHTSGALISSYPITGLPVGVGNLSDHMVGYTGCPGQEILVMDIVLNRAYLIDKATGAYVATSEMPGSAVTSGSWYDFSFTNKQLFIRNGNDWYGYYVFPECTSMTTTVSDDTLCDGDELTLHAGSTLGGTITWDGGVADSVAFTPPVGTTTYTATSSDPLDCPFSVEIFVGDLPTVDAGADLMFCTGDSVMLNATGTATDWSWDGGITNGVNFLPPTGTTTYTVTGTIDSTGCMATDAVDVAEVIIDNTISVGLGDLTSNQAGATYQWLECPAYSIVAGETSQTYASVPDGEFAVEVTLDGCVDTSACQIVAVGINETTSTSLEVYPNPTSSELTISLNGKFNYGLMNLLGQTVLSGEANGQEEVDLSELPTGAYFLKVVTAEKEQTVKVVKK